MINSFPDDFRTEIDRILGDKSPTFWDALRNQKSNSGLRVNTLKIDPELLQQYIPGDLDSVAWANDGFRVEPENKLGKHPLFAAGLFYLQEPSAMAPVKILNPQPGELILDLCAAPGGKTTQILSLMKNQGTLVANDSNPKRAQALTRNVDRWGARNVIITCESPNRLAEHFGAIFDRVLVDAPCSGEGTFRSAPGEIKKWSSQFSNRCATIQDELLWFAGKMVRPGGNLVYSTCTFNQLENEGSVTRFLLNNPDFFIDPIPDIQGFSPGIPGANNDQLNLKSTGRIWPHLTYGEGHYFACIKKKNGKDNQVLFSSPKISSLTNTQKDVYGQFYNHSLNLTSGTASISPDSSSLTFYGNQLHLIPQTYPNSEGLRVLRWGWMIGTIKSDRFIPSPGLAYGLDRGDAQRVIEFPLEDQDLNSYMRGSPISHSSINFTDKGWILVTIEGFPAGWGKPSQGKMKSHFPNWLR